MTHATEPCTADQPPSDRGHERPVTFEPLTAADLDLVWETEKRAYAHPWSLGNFRDSMTSGYPAWLLTSPVQPGEHPWRLTASGHVLLGYWVAMNGVDEVHLLNIAVAPDYRRQGWARAMLHALCTQALAAQAQWVWLEVRTGNEAARTLYRDTGFREVGVRKRYYPAAQGEREDAVVMCLNLRATS